MRLIGLTVFFLFSSLILLFGQTDPCHKSTEGSDFWFGFMEGRNYQAGHYTEITITSSYSCKYLIYIGKSTIPMKLPVPLDGTVAPNIPVKVLIDWNLVEATGSESIQQKAIHLVSDQPVNVYALNWSPNSSEVALIYPTPSLGKEYYAMCYTPHINGNGINSGSGRNSEFLVVASEDSTLVYITPSVVTDQGKAANTLFTIKLNKGEVYQIQSANLPTPKYPGQGDLTGSYIASSKPVAVFSGSLSTTVPGGSTVSAWDHLYEQMPPIQAWGRTFIAVPLKTRHEDTYRVLASQDNTTVQIGSRTPVVINQGQYYEFSITYTDPSLIQSDKPVLLAQFSNSNSVDSYFTGGDGDPFLVIVSPVNQTRENVAFVAYDSQEITSKFFINVVVRNDAVGKIILDGNAVVFQTLSATGYSYAQVSIAKGNHYIYTTEPGKGFIAYVYGFGGVEAYGYGVGFNLNIVLDLGSNLNANGEKLLVRCDGAPPLTLDAGNAFYSYRWSTGDTTSTIQIVNDGWYKVKVSTIDGCVLQDSVELKVNKPILNLGNDTTICNPATIMIDAGAKDQFSSFSWATPGLPATTQKIVVSNPGLYSVAAVNKYGCIAKDSIKVSFANNPKLDFSKLDTLICGKKSDILDVASDKGNFTIRRLSDGFNFSDLNVSVPDFGTYQFLIRATDDFSCYSDSTIKLGFHAIPTVALSIDSTTCYHYNLDASYLGNADLPIAKFTWVFGGDTIFNGTGLIKETIPLGVNQSKRDLVLNVLQNGCSNHFTIPDIRVIPTLSMSVRDSILCMPSAFEFSATNTETGVAYDWGFGDGTSGTGTNPAHPYSQSGRYNVRLTVTTNKGCSNTASIKNMVFAAPIPDVVFTLNGADCLSPGNNQISYAGLIGTGQDTYHWDLTGLDAQEIIQDPAHTKGPLVFDLTVHPQFTLGLQVISLYGCQSAREQISLKRKPDFSMITNPVAGCIPFKPALSGKVNNNIDQVAFNWDFGDGTTGAGSPVSHTYGVPDKKYTINLTGKSSVTGCSNLQIYRDTLETYPQPVAKFSMSDSIVYNDKPQVDFISTSTGAINWLWDFGDGLTSALESLPHVYSVTGHRRVELTVNNEFNCTDSVSHSVLIAFDRIFTPTGFSPNAPNAVDRLFLLDTEGIISEGYDFTVLSRWDDIVFESKGEKKGWDGRMKDGSFAPAGVYLWILNFTDFLGRKHLQKGTVTVVY